MSYMSYIGGERDRLGPGDEDIMRDIRRSMSARRTPSEEAAKAAEYAARHAAWKKENLAGLTESPAIYHLRDLPEGIAVLWRDPGVYWVVGAAARFGKTDYYYPLIRSGERVGWLAIYGGLLDYYAWLPER